MNNNEKFIPLILRIAIGFLWIWMGIVPKLIYPKPRFMMVSKSWVAPYFPFSVQTFVYGLAVILIILGIMLILGLYTRLVSAIQIALMLMFVIGLWNIAAAEGITSPLAHLFLKDIPIAAGNIVLIITGGGEYSIDKYLGRKK